MAITPLPSVPLRSDTPANFIVKADAFLGALPLFQSECNAVAIALDLLSTNSVSSTSVAIGLGSKSFTVETNKSYVAGMTIKIASSASPSKWMLGDITSYNVGTGALVVNVLLIQDTGTFASWVVSQSPPIGDGNPPGTIIQYAGSTPPANYLSVGVAASTQLIADFPALYSAIGVLWGGDGVTTFGIPYIPTDEVCVQVGAGTIGTHTNGQVLNHTHNYNAPAFTVNYTAGATPQAVTGASATASGNPNSGGGSTNLSAGQRVKYCVRY
jgi:microcystin-dependent protein